MKVVVNLGDKVKGGNDISEIVLILTYYLYGKVRYNKFKSAKTSSARVKNIFFTQSDDCRKSNLWIYSIDKDC